MSDTSRSLRRSSRVEKSEGLAESKPALAPHGAALKTAPPKAKKKPQSKGVAKPKRVTTAAVAGDRICSDCGVDATVQWRRIEDIWYCNACGCARKRKQQKVGGSTSKAARARASSRQPRSRPSKASASSSAKDEFVAPKSKTHRKRSSVAERKRSGLSVVTTGLPQMDRLKTPELDAMTKNDPEFSGLMDVANLELLASQRMSPSKWREASPVDPAHPVAWMLRHPPHHQPQAQFQQEATLGEIDAVGSDLATTTSLLHQERIRQHLIQQQQPSSPGRSKSPILAAHGLQEGVDFQPVPDSVVLPGAGGNMLTSELRLEHEEPIAVSSAGGLVRPEPIPPPRAFEPHLHQPISRSSASETSSLVHQDFE